MLRGQEAAYTSQIGEKAIAEESFEGQCLGVPNRAEPRLDPSNGGCNREQSVCPLNCWRTVPYLHPRFPILA